MTVVARALSACSIPLVPCTSIRWSANIEWRVSKRDQERERASATSDRTVSIACMTAEIDGSESARREAQRDDDRVVVVQGRNVLVEARAHARDGDRVLADDPAHEINVVAAAVVDDAAAGLEELDRRHGVVARRAAHHVNVANVAALHLLGDGAEVRVKAALVAGEQRHVALLGERVRAVDLCNVEAQRLLDEDAEAGLERLDHQLKVRERRRAHDDGLQTLRGVGV